MLPQITLIDCISSGKFKVPIITNTTPLNMLDNNIDISKAPLIRLIFFILRLILLVQFQLFVAVISVQYDNCHNKHYDNNSNLPYKKII